MSTPSLLILAGDGIGPEVMAEVRKIIDWYGEKRNLKFNVSEGLVGGCAYNAHGTPLTDETMARAQSVDAVLLGAVGGPKYDDLDFADKPERGLLRLRKEMDLFSNLRPAQCFDALKDFSSMKPEVVAGLDIMIIRELTSGIYFGEPRGITDDNEDPTVIGLIQDRFYLGIEKLLLILQTINFPALQQPLIQRFAPGKREPCQIAVTIGILDVLAELFQNVPVVGFCIIRRLTEATIALIEAKQLAGVI